VHRRCLLLRVKRTYLFLQRGCLSLLPKNLWNLRVQLRRISFHASLPIKRHRPPCCTLAGSRDAIRACAQETKCDQALARLWFLTRLSPTRSDRTRTRGALLQSLRAAILRPSLAGLLSRKMEWWRVRSLLDADADWADVELWPIAPTNRRGARSSHGRIYFVRAADRFAPACPLSGVKRHDDCTEKCLLLAQSGHDDALHYVSS